MKLREPYTGTVVQAEGEAAQMLLARGFAPADEPEKKPKPKSKKKAE